MATLTNQIDNLNKRVVALENSELSSTEAVPFIVKLYADFQVGAAIYCSEDTECSDDLELSAGATGTAEELGLKINYSAVGNSTLPNPGDIGVVGEVARKPVGSVTTVESSDTQAVLVFSSYFDEQAANGETLTSAAVLYDATESAGTGMVITSEAINIEKTSAKTLTVSTEITITEVV